MYAILRKTKEPHLGKWQKTCFWARFWPIGPKFRLPTFVFKNLCQSLDNMVSYHHVQYHKNLMIQLWQNVVMDRQTHKQDWFHTQQTRIVKKNSDTRTVNKLISTLNCLKPKCNKIHIPILNSLSQNQRTQSQSWLRSVYADHRV